VIARAVGFHSRVALLSDRLNHRRDMLPATLVCVSIAAGILACSGEPSSPDGAPHGRGAAGARDSGGTGGDGGARAADARNDDRDGTDLVDATRDVFGSNDALDAAPGDAGPALDFQFDTTISKVVLENYLSRSISFTELLHDDLAQPMNPRGVDPRDNIRLLIGSKAKFVGRALMLWGGENNLTSFVGRAKSYADVLHQQDPDLVLQAAEFEIVTRAVESVAVPPPVFMEFGQPVVTRSFVYRDMLYANGNLVNHWGTDASVPDMGRIETRMWFYHLASTYIDAGIEAIHFGQVSLMDQNDPGHVGWLDMLGRVRAYARAHARRHMVICDAHTPTGGYVEGGRVLFDAHAFPLRIAEVAGRPFKGVLQVGYADSLYKRSNGGITPSGWFCDHLPYLVEFDNFGSNNPGHTSSAPFIWGWDEITWFATQSEADRNDWLRYAWNWVHDNDPIGHVEMPGSRVLSPGSAGGPRWYWANAKSAACPGGFNTEATIRELWGTGP